jgi:hypothetical protein
LIVVLLTPALVKVTLPEVPPPDKPAPAVTPVISPTLFKPGKLVVFIQLV